MLLHKRILRSIMVGLFFGLMPVSLTHGTQKNRRKLMKNKENQTVFYYKDDDLIPELNPHSNGINFLYNNWLGKAARKVINKHFFSKIIGFYQDTRLSKGAIKHFIAAYNIDMSDYEKPANEYSSFNDFFCRKLKEGARPINKDQTIITAPADSKLFVIHNLSSESAFYVKLKKFSLEKFLKNKTLAQEFLGGTLMIFRLAPADYHRFHFPVDNTPSAPVRIRGVLESVNPNVYNSGVQALTENERHLMILDTKTHGTVLMMPVGAMCVGKIINTYTPNTPHKKGDEAGYFAFGGSTVVLLFKAGTVQPCKKFIEHSAQGYETAVKMGEAVTE
jgi:phosphatidylserine decarboxylase